MQSSDYRGQLGLISLARRDFQELSDIFTATGESRSAAAKKTENAAQLEELQKAVDRVVLFVDDLDRCPSAKVVEVLQAVHLLLAFPLFAVVVGVDQRCLRTSLRLELKGLIAEAGEDPHTPGERPATPLDYLEKIFHVPFHLPKMAPAGFEALIRSLTAPLPATSDEPAQPTPPPPKAPEPQSAPIDASAIAETAVGDESTKGTQPASRETTAAAAPEPPPDEVLGSVPLQGWEMEALQQYHSLIATPRGAKRLLNTYRLLRAGLPRDEWSAFRGQDQQGEFRGAMLLLAAAAGHPAVARQWFERLRVDDATTILAGQNEGEDLHPSWQQLKKVYRATFDPPLMEQTKGVFPKWIARVARYAF